MDEKQICPCNSETYSCFYSRRKEKTLASSGWFRCRTERGFPGFASRRSEGYVVICSYLGGSHVGLWLAVRIHTYTRHEYATQTRWGKDHTDITGWIQSRDPWPLPLQSPQHRIKAFAFPAIDRPLLTSSFIVIPHIKNQKPLPRPYNTGQNNTKNFKELHQTRYARGNPNKQKQKCLSDSAPGVAGAAWSTPSPSAPGISAPRCAPTSTASAAGRGASRWASSVASSTAEGDALALVRFRIEAS